MEIKSLKYCKATLFSIVAARLNSDFVQRIFKQKNWFSTRDGHWVCSFPYEAMGWENPRRMVVVRKDVGKHPETGGKLLFLEIAEFESYRYSAFFTNVDLLAETVWYLYNQRTDCENRIRELKYDYGIEGFSLNDFYATEAAFR